MSQPDCVGDDSSCAFNDTVVSGSCFVFALGFIGLFEFTHGFSPFGFVGLKLIGAKVGRSIAAESAICKNRPFSGLLDAVGVRKRRRHRCDLEARVFGSLSPVGLDRQLLNRIPASTPKHSGLRLYGQLNLRCNQLAFLRTSN